MNRNKRIVSCPTLLPRCSRKSENEVNSSSVLKKIRNQYAKSAPRVMGNPVKLSDLFTAVVVRGGYRMVCEQRLWSEVARALCLPVACTNSSIGLRRIYYQYLSKHEICEYPALSENFLAQNFVDFPNIDSPPDLSCLPATSVERNLGIDQNIPTGGLLHSNYHSFPELPTASAHLSHTNDHNQDITWPSAATDKSTSERSESDGGIRFVPGGYTNLTDPARLQDPSELRLIELSLQSGLPNEVDMALNSLLALSVTPSPTGASTSVRLAHCSNLLHLILATVGIYDDSPNSFVICDPVWRKQTQLDFLKFWHNMIEDREGRLFLRPDVFINAEFDVSDNLEDNRSFVELFAPCSVSEMQSNGTAFRLRTTELNEDAETARTLLVATILVNLVTPNPTYSECRLEEDDDESEYDALVTRTLSAYSFTRMFAWRENARYIAANPTGLRFAFLTSHARHSGLRQLGLQLLSSLRYPLDPPAISLDYLDGWIPFMESGCRLADLTLSFLVRSILDSHDRASLIAGLTFLSNLAKVPEKANEISLVNGLPSAIWPRLAQLICLPDLAVVCAGLDALRCFTNLGHFACMFVWQACIQSEDFESNALPLSLLQPLLSLLTLEGQSMGSQSLHRIKLMQRRPPPITTHPYNHSRPIPQNSNRPSDWHVQNPQYRMVAIQPTPNTAHYLYRSSQRFVPHSKVDIIPAAIPGPPTRPYVSSTVENVSRPPRIERPAPPALGAEFVSDPNDKTYRPPSGTISCTGLINLLTSTTPPPSSSVPATIVGPSGYTSPTTVTTPTAITLPNTSNPDQITITSSVSIKPASTIPALPTPTPSLSELTDRLQMPPPSLPPPSALRRSAKSIQPRCTSVAIHSPSAVSRPKTEPSSPKQPPSSFVSSSTLMKIESTSSSTVLETPCSTGSLTSDSRELSTEVFPSMSITKRSNRLAPDDHIKSEAMSTAEQSVNSAETCLDSSFSMNGGCDNCPSLPIAINIKQTKLAHACHQSKPLVNGGMDNHNRNINLKLCDQESTEISPPALNGLKSGILHAAMKVLENRNLGKEHNNEFYKHLTEPEHVLVNGSAELESLVSSKAKLYKTLETESVSTNQLRNCLNGMRKPSSAKGLVLSSRSTESANTNGQHNDFCNSSPDPTAVQIMNGNSGSSSSSGSETDGNSTPNSPNPKTTRYLLKRRRRWGSRSRLFTLKRRREHTSTTAYKSLNSASPSNSTVSTSPLKPLPIQSDPLPDSVLGPDWKPQWSSVDMLPPTNLMVDGQAQNSSSLSFTQGLNGGKRDSPQFQYSICTQKMEDRLPATSDAGASPPTYLCEWESCTASFNEKSQVSSHVYLTHLTTKSDTGSQSSAYVHPAVPVRRCCRWRGCSSSSLARAPFALLTHVLDIHCTSMEGDTRRLPSESKDMQNPLLVSSPSSSSLYELQNLCSTVPADVSSSPSGDPSAWNIIRSLQAKQMQLDLWVAQHHFFSANPHSRLPLTVLGPNPHQLPTPLIAPPPREGPVTKHLRVSAALVLRNFVTHIEEARTWLLSELPLLSEVVMGCSPSDGNLRTNDASRIVAQCLSISSRTQMNASAVPPFLPTKPLPDEFLPRDILLPLFRTHRHRKYFGTSFSPFLQRSPVFNVDLDAHSS